MIPDDNSCYGMKWNGRENLVWSMEFLKYGREWKISLMEWKEFFILQYIFFIFALFNVVFILSAVNKVVSDQTRKMIKEENSSKGLSNKLGKKKKKELQTD